MFTHHSDYKEEITLFEIGYFQDYSGSFCVNVSLLSAVKFTLLLTPI